MCALSLTLNKFPVDAKTKDGAGLPFGCVVQPFASELEVIANDAKCSIKAGRDMKAEQVERCLECFGYVNRFCYFDYRSWMCSLCGAVNPITKRSRYHNIPQRSKLGELSSGFVDVEYQAKQGEGNEEGRGEGEGEGEAIAAPAFVALVDTSGTEEQLEVVKSAVLAGLEALAPNALFGLVTFSDKIGLFDVKGKRPCVKVVPLPEGASEEYVNGVLNEVLPLKWFLAEVEDHKDAFSTAIESITPTSRSAGCRFGPAIHSLAAYLSGKQLSDTIEDQGDNMNPSGIAYSRVMTFLLSPPSSGSGTIDQNKRKGLSDEKSRVSDACQVVSMTQDFYLKMGLHASLSGISCDLYIIGESNEDYFDLASVRCLSQQSGGKLFYYGSIEECNAPQDLYSTLAQPYAINCTFRIRTTNEFRISKSYGQLVEHQKYKNLYHVVACCSTSCFGFDFKFSSSGFSRDPELSPTIQLAFQYSLFEPGDPAESTSARGEGEGEDVPQPKQRHVMKRRLRIYTKQIEVAKSILDLYDYVDSRAVISLLIHKCGQVMHEKGLEEARSLVEDWMINLVGQYNIQVNRRLIEAGDTVENPDVIFRECKGLEPIPYLVYGMLRGDIFSHTCISEDPDRWVYLFSAYTSNPPKDIVHAIYPSLSAYSDKTIYRKQPLSKEMLKENEGYIYMIDSFFKLVVYYTRKGLEAQPFPPPHDGFIRREISNIRLSRGTSPLVVFVREGIDDERPFEDLLLEEQAKVGSGSAADYGFSPFLDVMRTEVETFLAES